MKRQAAQKATAPSQKAKRSERSRVSPKKAAAPDARRQEKNAISGQARALLKAGNFFSEAARQAAHKSSAALHLKAVCHGKATKNPHTPPMSEAATKENSTPARNEQQNGESVPSALS